MSDVTQRRKAKNLVIDSDFQVKTWMRTSALALIAVSTLVFLYVYFNFTLFNEIKAVLGDHPQAAAIYKSFKISSIALILLLLLIAVVNFFLSLRSSHRVIGPIYRMRTYLEDVLNGDCKGPLKLRQGDHFEELAELIEKVCEQQNSKKDQSDPTAS